MRGDATTRDISPANYCKVAKHKKHLIEERCPRCRGTGRVFVRPPSEFDTRTVTSEMPCDCQRTTDGLASYTLAIAAKREEAVRAGILPPIDERELRQREEGPRENSELDCVRGES